MIAEATHSAGRKVTVGSASLKWSSHAQEADASYWDDDALKKAYSSNNGTLDFYNVHYYDWMFNPTYGYDPMRANTAHWQLDKPTVVAEMVSKSSHYSVADVLSKSTNNGFMGVLFWGYNDPDVAHGCSKDDVAPLKAYSAAQGASYTKILDYLAAPTPPPRPPPCTDTSPDTNTCAQQKGWGKCTASFMQGYCCKTCFDCKTGCGSTPPPPPPPAPPTPPTPGCTDTSPDANTCAQQKSWGKCDVKANPWMAGYCCESCFNCAVESPCGTPAPPATSTSTAYLPPSALPLLTLGALPDIVNGWNVSVGTERQRDSAAEFFRVKVSNDNSLWTRNIMTPFRGKTLRMTGIVIEKRNAFNTLIEHEVKNGNVTWTVEKGPQGVCGDWVEHINGGYTGVAHMAGWVSRNEWIENDNKSIFGHKTANDWGVVTATSATSTTVVMKYWSYQKAKFTMTWTLT